MAATRPRRPRGGRPGGGDFDHADWLGLIDVSGPFLSVPVLRNAWPVLDTLDKPTREQLRQAHTALPGRPWIEYVLIDLLGWKETVHFDGLAGLGVQVPEHETEVVPSFALLEPGALPGEDAGPVRLLGLISDGPPTRRVAGSDWAATPADRLAHLLRARDVPLGLATDGRWWTLVWAPRGGVTTTAVFDAIGWHEAAERIVVSAFVSLLSRERFFGVPDGETLPELLKASLDNQEDITEALGVQVRQAVELLVAAIGRAHTEDRARGGAGIGDVPAHEVYRGAVAVMMRIVFLLFAEERGLLPADKPLFREAYSAGLLFTELEERARSGSEDELDRTYDGWHRLLALFNAVYYGVEHPEMPMHAHDGSIFDPDTYAWLPHGIDDRTVLHMLKAVQTVEIGTGRSRERRKLSFRALDVEQIGYVYEGLLAFEGLYADETVVGLVGKAGFEEEVKLSHLEALAAEAAGDAPALAARLATDYKSSGIGSAKAIEKRLAELKGADATEARRKLYAVTGGDHELTERIMPFHGLLRTDLRDQPLVILTDALYVTESSLRKTTGTHYTPKWLAEEVVEGALEPLVYAPGPLQTADKEQWKPKSSAEILGLKVADIAMGSAAFLVAACRYLAGHLVNAWEREDDPRAAGYGGRAEGLEPADLDTDPVVIEARRAIIEHCLYGADINEMAVEMAKLSLWLVSMDPHRPFTFLDDRLVVGDSLLGITSLEQLEVMHMDPVRGRKLQEKEHEAQEALVTLTAGVRELAREVAERRRVLAEVEGRTLESLRVKRSMLERINKKAEDACFLADLTVGAALAFASKGASGFNDASGRAVQTALKFTSGEETGAKAAREQARSWLATDQPVNGFDRKPIHWPLVYPEVMDKGGFDAIIGNPPFLGGQKLTGSLGTAYREYLVETIGHGVRGSADLVAYFVLKAHELLNADGQTGLIATNTLAQGDTREVGLNWLTQHGTFIRQAVKSKPWPSRSAVLEYSAVWTSKELISGKAVRIVDGAKVEGITSSLEPESRVSGTIHRLAASADISFQGSTILGLGFTMDPEEGEALIGQDRRYSEVLFPYVNGRDLNSSPSLSASRWVVNFHDWPEDRAKNYPACYDRVLRLVKPERDLNKREARRERWWQFAERAPRLYKRIANLKRVIAIARVSKTVMPVFVDARQVISEMIVVISEDDAALLALLSSAPHYWWAISRASSMKADLRYTPSDVFETLPLPELTQDMRDLGERLDSFRREVMMARQAGLTKTYNLIHDPDCGDADIVELREIHKSIDESVCRAYGWDDLIPQLAHGHYDLGREARYTVTPIIQRELVDRLLELNHERYAAEVAAGLHDKKGSKKRQQDEQDGLF
ncbi:Eco57I restriction-modification methylase domain-containing protein [Actinomadura parmotrematis]|uniref:site-specific DNA-methyltransferase (adenine-specific) n=1 Tax=Actinomadura parmotrematis TaxID=2864039 RepID=A0ABS7FZ11_9ACTN|nr:DNA methyltransferase [Actinomadura parmotrematis]MBW8485536.1 hypothetical protein [Actinomadura parmotrematis]